MAHHLSDDTETPYDKNTTISASLPTVDHEMPHICITSGGHFEFQWGHSWPMVAILWFYVNFFLVQEYGVQMKKETKQQRWQFLNVNTAYESSEMYKKAITTTRKVTILNPQQLLVKAMENSLMDLDRQ